MSDVFDISQYDFADFGCSHGGSMDFAVKHLGGRRGIGLDINPTKIAAAREQGFEAMTTDLTGPENIVGRVRFSTLFHFLEHVPSLVEAERILRAAVRLSLQFVLIRQPWFDADDYLAKHGLKFYWSDWTGHPNHMTTEQMREILDRMLDEGLIRCYVLYGSTLVKDSRDVAVIPLEAGRDRHRYDPAKDPPKPEIVFDRPIYREMVCFIDLVASDGAEAVRSIGDLVFLCRRPTG